MSDLSKEELIKIIEEQNVKLEEQNKKLEEQDCYSSNYLSIDSSNYLRKAPASTMD